MEQIEDTGNSKFIDLKIWYDVYKLCGYRALELSLKIQKSMFKTTNESFWFLKKDCLFQYAVVGFKLNVFFSWILMQNLYGLPCFDGDQVDDT